MTLEERLEAEEGFVPHAYQDKYGFWTIGIGTLIDKRKGGAITRDAARFMLREKLVKIETQLDMWLPWWRGLDETRCQVLMAMAYQMGVAGVLKFKGALAAMQRGDYKAAAEGMLDSKWAREDSPARAMRAAIAMQTGCWPSQ